MPNKDTLARAITTLVVAIFVVLKIFGIEIGFDESYIYEVVLAVITVGTWFWGFWKNNSFTHEAKLGDEYMQILKERRDDVGGDNDANTEEEHVALDPEEV